jgi:hypothetical protein
MYLFTPYPLFSTLTINHQAAYVMQFTQISVSKDKQDFCLYMFLSLLANIRRHNQHYKGSTFRYVKSSFFWYISPCSPLKVSGHFAGTCRLHLQVRKAKQETNVKQASCRTFGFLLGLFFNRENGGDFSLRSVG